MKASRGKERASPGVISALLAVADLGLRWLLAVGYRPDPEIAALGAATAFARGTATLPDIDRACTALPPLLPVAALSPLHLAHREARQAVLLVCTALYQSPLTEDAAREWQRKLRIHTTNIGRHLQVADAQTAVLMAERVLTAPAAAGPARGGVPRSPSPEFVRALARGKVLAGLRERVGLSHEELAERTLQTGLPVTAVQVVKVENATASSKLSIQSIASCLGQSEASIDQIAERACALAAKVAELALAVQGPGWYADAVLVVREETARAIVMVAAAAAIRDAANGGVQARQGATG